MMSWTRHAAKAREKKKEARKARGTEDGEDVRSHPNEETKKERRSMSSEARG